MPQQCGGTATAGAGVAKRPPTLTELYAAGPFIGTINPGLSFVQGDPELDPERRTQIDVGIYAEYERVRMSANGFYAWVKDFIIYEDVLPTVFFVPGQQLQEFAFGNTEMAILTGFELAGDYDVNSWLTAFGIMSYVEGRDLSRQRDTRVATLIRESFFLPSDLPRSLELGSPHEALPNIPPLEAIVGIRFHDPCPQARWGVELEARIVDNQDRVARTLFEFETGGFTVWNLRSFWQTRDNLTLIAGVENFTDKFYREHLDFRSGRGVFRPGVNFYFSSELTYRPFDCSDVSSLLHNSR